MRLRYYGHPHLSTGYGRAAMHLLSALDRAGVQLDVRCVGPGDKTWLTKSGVHEDWFQPTDHADAVLVHTLPGDCHRVLELEALRRGAGAHLIAYTTWEALTAPLDVITPLYSHFDQVWTPSRASALALAENGEHGNPTDRAEAVRGTHVVPHCFDEEVPGPSPQYAEAEKFRFYWIGAWSARKNPAGLIRAFSYAFYPGADVELVMHSPGTSVDTFAATMAATGLRQHELPPIVISTQHLTEESIAQFHADADCFVSAARGEAWNLPAFDAVRAGRHVITQYGLGSDEFLTDTSADLVDGWEAPAHVDVSAGQASDGSVTFKTIGAQGLTARSLWLEPNLSSLAEAMRSAYQTRKRTIKLDYDLAARFSYAAVGKQALQLLEKM